jgi:hypothetical protein
MPVPGAAFPVIAPITAPLPAPISVPLEAHEPLSDAVQSIPPEDQLNDFEHEDDSAPLTFVVTFFADFAAETKHEQLVGLDDLAQLIHNTAAPAKEQLPWLKLARFGDTRTKKGSLRHNANLVSASGIEADYDRGEMSLAEAKDIIARAGTTALIYPSPSYTPDAPKWRVLCPFSREYPPAERDRFMARLNGLFGGIFSRESWVISQSYYYGRVHNPGHHATVFEGTCIDQRPDLDAKAIGLSKERNAGTQAHPRSRPEDITEARVRGIINALLANISAAHDGEKHFVLRDNSRALGGYLHLTGWSVDEAAEQAVGALRSADDWDKARKTALWAIRHGMEKQLELGERPCTRRNGADHNKPEGGVDGDGAEPPPGWEDQHPPYGSRTSGQVWPDPIDCFAPVNLSPAEVTEDEAPPALWPFIKDTAERMGVATSTVTLSAIVTCSAVISDEWRLQPKRYDYLWTENARLWGAIVGPPSILKTPVLVACTRPIDHLESEARKQWQEDLRRWRKAEAAAKAEGRDFTDPEPKRPRWLVESTTIEALQEVLRDDEGGRFTAPAKKVLVRQDELSEFLANLDRYASSGRQGGDRGAYLRLYNGGPFSVDRIGRGAFTASNWSGCLLGGIQPEPIQRIAKQTVDDGLLQRMTYDVPPPEPGSGTDCAPDRNAIERYDRLIPALSALRPASSQDQRTRAVTLHADAHAYRESIDKTARNTAAMPDISSRLQSALGKWPGLFARLCLTFHLIEVADAKARGDLGPPIGVVSAATAERVVRYMRRVLLRHLLRADALMFTTVQTGHAKWIAGHVLAHQLDRITVRDVNRAYLALRPPEARNELHSVMASLVSIGWLDPEPPRNPLNPVSAWRVNPLVHGLYAAQAENERQERQKRAEETIERRQAYANRTR